MIIQPQLIKDCIDQNKRAEYTLYKTLYSYLMSICIRYTKQEETAKEVLNIGYLKILNNLKQYDSLTPFKPWVRKIIINTLIDEYRKEQRHTQTVEYIEDYQENGNQFEINQAIEKFNVQDIYKLISQLPPTSREVFNLYVIDDYSHKEIAEILGMSEGTSKWHLNTARQKLRASLEKKELLITSDQHE